MRSRPASARLPAAVSGSASVMYSGACVATMGCCEAGAAIVQRPTPLRSAARAASTAAPVLPSEPATIRRWPKRPLWASASRAGKYRRTSAASSRQVVTSRSARAAARPPRPPPRRPGGASAASPGTPAGRAVKNTVTAAPRPRRRRATTKPSPPLLPLPHTMTMRRPRIGASQRPMSAAAPEPAASMSWKPGMPRSRIARASSARISAAVKMGRTGSARRRQGQGRRLGQEVGEIRRVGLPVGGPGRARELDVERQLGLRENARLLGRGGGVPERIVGLHPDLEPGDVALGGQPGVADHLEEGLEPPGVVATHADGGDLHAARALRAGVAVHLDVEPERALCDLGHLAPVRLVDLAGRLGLPLEPRRPAELALGGAAALAAPA